MKQIEIYSPGILKNGICELSRNKCNSNEETELISVFTDKRELFVCSNCLQKKISSGEWSYAETGKHCMLY